MPAVTDGAIFSFFTWIQYFFLNVASAPFSGKTRVSLDGHLVGLLFLFFAFHLRVVSHPGLVLQLLDRPLEVELMHVLLVRVPGRIK